MTALRTDRVEQQLDDVLAVLNGVDVERDLTGAVNEVVRVLVVLALCGVLAVLGLAGVAGLCWLAIAGRG